MNILNSFAGLSQQFLCWLSNLYVNVSALFLWLSMASLSFRRGHWEVLYRHSRKRGIDILQRSFSENLFFCRISLSRNWVSYWGCSRKKCFRVIAVKFFQKAFFNKYFSKILYRFQDISFKKQIFKRLSVATWKAILN